MSWWEDAPLADAPASGGPKPLLDLSGGKARDLEIKEEGNSRDGRKEVRDVENTAFTQKDKLRADYEALPPVKEYRVALQSLASALDTKPDAGGDNALIYAYAKIMDPGSVVRESEMAMAAGADSAVNALAARIGKEFGWEQGGQLSPDARARLKREAINAVSQRVKAYNLQRERFGEYARRGGFDPYEVIGDHDGKPYLEKFRTIGRDGNPIAPKPVETVNGFAKGTDVELAGGDGPGFNRDSFLETLGLDNKKESVLMAGLNQITGNPNLTAEDMLSVYEQAGVPLPDPAAFKQQLDYARKGYRFGPIDTTAQEAAYKAKVDEFAQGKDNVTGAVESGFQGATQGLTFGFGDELGAGMTTLLEGGTYDQNLERERIMRDGYRQANPIASYGSEILSSVAIPMGVADTPLDLARIGGASGALYGMGSSDGDIADRIVSGGTGAAIGMVAAPALGQVVNMAAPYVRKAADTVSDILPKRLNPEGAEFYQAATAEGLTPTALDVGGATAKRVGQATAQSPYGSAKMIAASNNLVDGADKRLLELAKQTGIPMKGEQLGGALKEGATNVINGLKNTARAKYKRAGDAVGQEGVALDNTVTLLNDEITSLEKTGLSSQILNVMGNLRTKISEGPMDVETLRRIRTRLRTELVEAGSKPSEAKDIASRINTSITEDITRTLNTKGKQAEAALYREADNDWRALSELRDTVFTPITGKNGEKSGEAVAKALMADLKGNNARAVKFLKALPEEQRQDTVASIIGGLGRSDRETAEGGAFSLGRFLSAYGDIGETAKAAYFGPELAASLRNLAKVAEGSRVSGKYAGHSNTGAVNALNFTNAGITGAAAALFSGQPAVAAALALPAVTQKLTATLLTRPEFVKWLARLPKLPNPGAVNQHVTKLERIAKAEPVIANEVLQLQSVLKDAFQQYPERLAAQEPEQGQGAEQPATQRTTGAPQ